jgi:hypothetical protein
VPVYSEDLTEHIIKCACKTHSFRHLKQAVLIVTDLLYGVDVRLRDNSKSDKEMCSKLQNDTNLILRVKYFMELPLKIQKTLNR